MNGRQISRIRVDGARRDADRVEDVRSARTGCRGRASRARPEQLVDAQVQRVELAPREAHAGTPVAAISAACLSWSNEVSTRSDASDASKSGRRPLRRSPASRRSNRSCSTESNFLVHVGALVLELLRLGTRDVVRHLEEVVGRLDRRARELAHVGEVHRERLAQQSPAIHDVARQRRAVGRGRGRGGGHVAESEAGRQAPSGRLGRASRLF